MNAPAWLIRREFWENRAIWIIPAVLGAVMILAALFGRVDFLNGGLPLEGRALGSAFLVAVCVTFYTVMSIYAGWYLLDCLYADRKDRSVLFWKSLPISDTATVLSKLATAVIAIPVVYFIAADVTSLMLAFVISVRARATVGSSLWHADAWLQLQAAWVWIIVSTALWYLPVAGWLLLVSAWAKRAVMLWSILPPLALFTLERWFLGTNYVGNQIALRFLGYVQFAFHADPQSRWWVTQSVDDGNMRIPAGLWSILDFGGFFSSAQMWLGVGIGAALIAGAIQLRMRRAEN